MGIIEGKGKLTITRPSDPKGEYISIRLIENRSGANFVEAIVSLEEFTRALTGLGHVSCDLTLRLKNVGKRREIKHETVPIRHKASFKDRRAEAKKDLAPYEVGGWIGSAESATNHHNVVRYEDDIAYVVVGFERYVEDEGGEDEEEVI